MCILDIKKGENLKIMNNAKKKKKSFKSFLSSCLLKIGMVNTLFQREAEQVWGP